MTKFRDFEQCRSYLLIIFPLKVVVDGVDDVINRIQLLLYTTSLMANNESATSVIPTAWMPLLFIVAPPSHRSFPLSIQPLKSVDERGVVKFSLIIFQCSDGRSRWSWSDDSNVPESVEVTLHVRGRLRCGGPFLLNRFQAFIYFARTYLENFIVPSAIVFEKFSGYFLQWSIKPKFHRSSSSPLMACKKGRVTFTLAQSVCQMIIRHILVQRIRLLRNFSHPPQESVG